MSFAVRLFDQHFSFYVRSLTKYVLPVIYRVLCQDSQVKTLTWPFPEEIFFFHSRSHVLTRFKECFMFEDNKTNH